MVLASDLKYLAVFQSDRGESAPIYATAVERQEIRCYVKAHRRPVSYNEGSVCIAPLRNIKPRMKSFWCKFRRTGKRRFHHARDRTGPEPSAHLHNHGETDGTGQLGRPLQMIVWMEGAEGFCEVFSAKRRFSFPRELLSLGNSPLRQQSGVDHEPISLPVEQGLLPEPAKQFIPIGSL